MNGFVKICGLTDAAAVDAALAAGADAIGFVFANSPRQVTPGQAYTLAAPARGRVACVAVTLHPSQAAIDDIVDGFGPDVLQTDAADFARLELPATLLRLPVLRVGASDGAGASDGVGLAASASRLRVLFEGPRSGAGLTADWNEARRLVRQCEVVLAGGLSPANVADAIDVVAPFGVDVSSGVEASPGRKDPVRIATFVANARAAFARSRSERSTP